MGGTTAKMCLINGGARRHSHSFEAARVHRFKRGSGLPLRISVIEMIEIGAGGGSIARLDNMGLIKVGPESAGSDPGPACYGHGGARPTVTDADVVLGYLDPTFFLGGAMSLDRAAADSAILQHLGKPYGSTWSRRRPASRRSSTRAWRPRRGCMSANAAATSATTRSWPSAAPVPSTPIASPRSSA